MHWFLFFQLHADKLIAPRLRSRRLGDDGGPGTKDSNKGQLGERNMKRLLNPAAAEPHPALAVTKSYYSRAEAATRAAPLVFSPTGTISSGA